MMGKYNTIIFDLDGTLLDTLDDLTDSVNYALRKSGLPEKTRDDVRTFVGNGIGKLIELCVPGGKSCPIYGDVFECFRKHYESNCKNKTKPYDGIINLLSELKSQGYKMAVVSNKVDAAVKELVRTYFVDFISVAIGERENVRKKPYPDSVNTALSELGVEREESVYIGDSDVDIETAINSGLDCISVTWGFRTIIQLKEKGAKTIVGKPEDIIKILK